jgi:hypothetical protein
MCGHNSQVLFSFTGSWHSGHGYNFVNSTYVMVFYIIILADDINSPWKHCCATISIFILLTVTWNFSSTQRTRYFVSIATMGTRTRCIVTLRELPFFFSVLLFVLPDCVWVRVMKGKFTKLKMTRDLLFLGRFLPVSYVCNARCVSNVLNGSFRYWPSV